MNYRIPWLVAGLVGLTAPAFGQDVGEISAREITRAFENQIPVRELGLSRGIKLAPTGGEDAAEEEADSYVELPSGNQINAHINFDFDSAVIRPQEEALLAKLCEGMRGADVPRFQIIGHADASGSASYNANLSRLRAEEVQRYLVDRCGMDANRLRAVGMGEDVPLEGTDPRAQENRRVEFQATS